MKIGLKLFQARLAQSVERQALNLMVVGSSPTVGAYAAAAMEGHLPPPNNMCSGKWVYEVS